MTAKVLFLSAFFFVAMLDAIEAHRWPCPPTHFRCFNGKCISHTWFCDRQDDCGDASDERYCHMKPLNASCPTEDTNWFLCGDWERCIPNEWRCDGRRNCADNSDEVACEISADNGTTVRFHQHTVRHPGVGEAVVGNSSSNGTTNATAITSEEGTEVTADPLYLTTPSYETSTLQFYSGYRGNSRPYTTGFATKTTSVQGRKGTSVHSFPGIRFALRYLTERLLDTRQETHSINKWGPQLMRATVALFLANPSYFVPGNRTGSEIAYELSLQMMSKLTLKKKIYNQELSLFINALIVSCINPKDFFGVDLVAELRTRVNNSNYTNPSIFLTLCNAGDTMTQTDVLNVNSTFFARHRPLWTDIQALATMAMACISTRSNLNASEDILNKMVAELKRKQPKNGTNGNLKTTALVLQALISTDSYQDNFEFRGALTFVLQQLNSTYTSFPDMYYVLPVLNSKSLVNINSNHCTLPLITELQMLQKLREHPEERVQTKVSVFIGEEKDFVRTWQLKVPSNYSFYQVLETIAALEPAYKVHYSVSEDKKPHVNGLSIFFDEAGEGLYWFIYVQNLKDTNKPRLVEKSPVDIPLKEDEELILWYRSGEWADPP